MVLQAIGPLKIINIGNVRAIRKKRDDLRTRTRVKCWRNWSNLFLDDDGFQIVRLFAQRKSQATETNVQFNWDIGNSSRLFLCNVVFRILGIRAPFFLIFFFVEERHYIFENNIFFSTWDSNKESVLVKRRLNSAIVTLSISDKNKTDNVFWEHSLKYGINSLFSDETPSESAATIIVLNNRSKDRNKINQILWGSWTFDNLL